MKKRERRTMIRARTRIKYLEKQIEDEDNLEDKKQEVK